MVNLLSHQPVFPRDKIFLIAPQECGVQQRNIMYAQDCRGNRQAYAPAQSRAAGRDLGDFTTIGFDYSFKLFQWRVAPGVRGGNREAPKRQSWNGPGETRRVENAGEMETKERIARQGPSDGDLTTQMKDKQNGKGRREVPTSLLSPPLKYVLFNNHKMSRRRVCLIANVNFSCKLTRNIKILCDIGNLQ